MTTTVLIILDRPINKDHKFSYMRLRAIFEWIEITSQKNFECDLDDFNYK